MWEKLQDFDLEFQVKACDVASLSNVQDDFVGFFVEDATNRYDSMMIYVYTYIYIIKGSLVEKLPIYE